MRDWTLRRAKPEDEAALAECLKAAYSIYANTILDLPLVSQGVAEDIENNLVWVAQRDGRIIGGLVLVQQADHMILANVAVSPDAAGHGLGRALMNLSEAESRTLGYDELRLNTHVDMHKNIRLYEHLGWREVERSETKVRMAKFIGQ